MGFYRPALICTNGHIITTNASHSSFSTPYCAKCGAPTISSCPNCHHQIDGDYHVDGVINLAGCYDMQLPAYCPYCGNPFPWTETAINSAINLINAAESLSNEEKVIFKENVSEILSETPKTKVSTIRIHKILTKISPTIANGIKDVLVEVCAESVKKILFS